MTKRIFIIATIFSLALFSCLVLSGCNAEGIDDETRKTAGLVLGLMIVAASGAGFWFSGRHFNRKKQQARRNRSKSKKRKR